MPCGYSRHLKVLAGQHSVIRIASVYINDLLDVLLIQAEGRISLAICCHGINKIFINVYVTDSWNRCFLNCVASLQYPSNIGIPYFFCPKSVARICLWEMHEQWVLLKYIDTRWNEKRETDWQRAKYDSLVMFRHCQLKSHYTQQQMSSAENCTFSVQHDYKVEIFCLELLSFF